MTRRVARQNTTDTLRLGSLEVEDLAKHTVTSDGTEVKLTAKEFLLLRYLLEHRGRVSHATCCSVTSGVITTPAARAPSTCMFDVFGKSCRYW